MDIVFFLLIITTLINLILASFIYLKNQKNWINISFSLFALSTAFWAFTNAICLKIEIIEGAIFWSQLSYLSAIFIATTFFYFSLVFPSSKNNIVSKNLGIKKWHKTFIVLFAFLTSIVIFIPGFTVETVILYPWKIITGPGLYLFGAYFFGVMSWAFINLLRKLFIFQGKERVQLIYVLGGIIFSTIIGAFFNLILSLLNDYRFVFLGPIFSLAMIGAIAYAIAKHQLFEIKVILTSFFVGLIAILLAVDLFVFTPFLYLQIFKGLALIIFLFFGYFLIKSVIREIKQKEGLEIITVELKKANIKLRKLDRVKSEFLSITSHQLRTPLTMIKGYVSMMIDRTYGEIPKEIQKPLENIYASNERLIKLVNNILNLSRIEAGKMELNLKKESLEEVIIDVIKELGLIAKNKQLYLKFKEPPKRLTKILIDKDKIREVIFNIIDNAIKYTDQGGIIIELKESGTKYIIKIKDTGQGMNKEEIDYLFQSFSRGKAGKKSWVEGSGLGLHIAKKLVEMHCGEVWAKSSGKNKGSTFFIKLRSLTK